MTEQVGRTAQGSECCPTRLRPGVGQLLVSGDSNEDAEEPWPESEGLIMEAVTQGPFDGGFPGQGWSPQPKRWENHT